MRRSARMGVLVGGWLGLAAAAAWAQERPQAQRGEAAVAPSAVIRVREFTGLRARDRVQTPDFDYTTNLPRSTTRKREWQRLAVVYDTVPEWIDELVFRYYVLMVRQEAGRRQPTLASGTVTYLDVRGGRRHESTMYLHPNARERWGEPVAVAVEVLRGGQVLVSQSEEKEPLPPQWWQKPELQPRDRYLLNPWQTPFALINYDDGEFIKP